MKAKRVEKNTAAKKTVEKKAVAAVKPVETAVSVSEVKAKVEEPVKETKVEAKPVAVAKKPAKAVAAKKTATKAAAKKETAPKAAASKTTKAASQKIVLQVEGRELDMESIMNRVKEAYAAEGHSTSSIKDIAIYIKPQENMVYYVIDDYASGISLY